VEVRVCKYNYNWVNDKNNTTIDTTSRSLTWSRGLSPFLLGPVALYEGITAKNMENAWQYSKVYPEHVNERGLPTEAWFKWAAQGYAKERADRYPMGKGKIPLYSYWGVFRYGYIDARKKIYAPLYAQAVEKTNAFAMLKELKEECKGTLWLMDFDAYDHKKEGLTYEQVINNPNRKMGHAFVLAMMLDNERVWEK
jgi:hypothetical protein